MSEGSPSEGQANTGLPYSLKLEETRSGIRIHAHAYTLRWEDAVDTAIKMMERAAMELEIRKIPHAPMKADDQGK